MIKKQQFVLVKMDRQRVVSIHDYNSILPGVVGTPMYEQLTRAREAELGISYEERLKQSLSSIPQGEFQEAHDTAYAALFLASDEARHITGTKMIVDGGLTMSS